jgi:hypothetical protein
MRIPAQDTGCAGLWLLCDVSVGRWVGNCRPGLGVGFAGFGGMKWLS